MRKLLFLLASVIFTVSAAQAQYDAAVGARLTYGVGVTYKKNLNTNKFFEGIGYASGFGSGTFVSLTGLYEVHKDIPDIKNLNWYFGGGADVAFYTGVGSSNAVSVGLDGIIGLDYTFADLPLNISLDYLPRFSLNGGYGFYGRGGAFSIRYVLK